MKAPKPGETIALRRGQTGQPAGLHLLHEVLEDGRLDVTSWRTLERFKVPIEDLVGWDGEPVTLDQRRPAPVESPAPVGKPAQRQVRIHVTNRKYAAEWVSQARGRVTVHVDVGDVVGTNLSGQPIYAFDVDSDLANEFLTYVDHSFLPGREAIVVGVVKDPWTGEVS